VTDAERRPGPTVCVIARRGRFLVAEPFFAPAPAMTVGRRGSVEVREGDLTVVHPSAKGRGRVVQVLGNPDDVRAVLHAVAVDAGVSRPFGRPVEEQLAALARDPLPADPSRVDLRDELAFTVDPPDAKDHDDAISVRREGDGVRLFVHIADVSAFVPPGSPIDREAERRATSVYLPGRVEPMLPHELSSGVCSLQPERDRYAVTVEVAPDGDATFYRSMIRSRHRLTYPQVEDILAGRERADPAVLEALQLAAAASGSLRARRFARGALSLCLTETEFRFDERGVAGAHQAGEHAAHALVEDLMILANERVAELLAATRTPALFRVHERPDPAAIEALVAQLEVLDVPTPPVPDLHTGADAARYAARVTEAVCRYVETSGRGGEAFPGLVLRSLKRARYAPANLGHSGLASTAYAHFTSPIRRYPDLVVHRALLRHLGLEEGVASELDRLAEHTSELEREATAVERRGDDICRAFLLERQLFHRGWEEPFDGWVSGLVGGGAFVRFGGVFEGFLPARFVGGDHYDLDEALLALVGRASGRRLRLGDPVRVVVRTVDRPRGRVLVTTDAVAREPSGTLWR
jgi:ribonuclease R